MPMMTAHLLSEDTASSCVTSNITWKVAAAGEIEEKPSAREGHCSCVVGSCLYVYGGVSIGVDDEMHEKDDLWRFDISEKKWLLVKSSAVSEKPLSRSAATMVCVGTKVYMFGGLNHSVGWLDDLFVFDTETSTWTEEDEFTGNPPSARDKLSSAVIGQQIWFFGGFGPQVASRGPLDMEDEEDFSSEDEIQQLEAQQQAAQFGWFDDLHVYDTETKCWSLPVQLSMGKPSPRCAASMVAHNKTLVIFGGRDSEGRLNDLHFFDTESKKWLKDRDVKGVPPACRSFHSAAMLGCSTMIVTGGRSTENQHFNDCHILHFDDNTWRKVGNVGLTARGCHTMDVIADSILVFGGSSAFNQTLQHCDTFHGDLLIANVAQEGAGDSTEGSPNKIRKVE